MVSISLLTEPFIKIVPSPAWKIPAVSFQLPSSSWAPLPTAVKVPPFIIKSPTKLKVLLLAKSKVPELIVKSLPTTTLAFASKVFDVLIIKSFPTLSTVPTVLVPEPSIVRLW